MTSPFITDVTDKNFADEVFKSDKPVLIDFYADWCGPCRAFTPTLEKFAEENKDKIKVVKVNVDNSPDLSTAFNIRSIPRLAVFKGTTVVMGPAGALSPQKLEAFVNQTLQTIDTNHISNKPPKGPTL